MTKRPHGSPLAGVALTLVTCSDSTEGEQAARILSGVGPRPEPELIETTRDDDAEFALTLAEWSAASALAGRGGNSVVVLAPTADVMEIALITEHVLESRRPALPVGIRDVIAVTSVQEVIEVLCPPATAEATPAVDLAEAGRLAGRIEFASIIALSDIDRAARPMGTALVHDLLARLAPRAQVVALGELASSRSRDAVLPRGRAHELGASMGWQLELAREASALPSDDAVGSFVFRDPRPFHPGRLHHAVLTGLTPSRVGRIVRSRGFVHLASRAGRVGSWATAGDVLDLDPTGLSTWDSESPVGQEIAFFGIGLDHAVLHRTLANCLLDDAELIAGPPSWATYADPFPEWPVHAH